MIDRVLTLLPTNRQRLLAWLIGSASVAAALTPPTATAGTITGAHSFSIVARLTGPAGSNSINPTSQVGIGGTDLGHMVNHKGKTYFLFGDTFASEASAGSGGPDWRNNVMAYSTDSTPANGITFDGWITRANGTARQVITPGTQPTTYIPTGAISVGDKIYAWYMHVSNWSTGWTLSHAGLASWREGDSQFSTVPNYRFQSQTGGAYTTDDGRVGGNFGMVAASYRSPLENSGDEHIYLWGTPGGREGGVKLARVLPNDIENLSAYRYYDGMFDGVPLWTTNEYAGERIIPSRAQGGTGVGEMSVMYNEAVGAWTMTYGTGGPGPDFEIRQAPQPWGPWSDPVRLVDFSQAPGGLYSPYMNPLYVEDDGKTLYFTMSLWNPYDVYLAKVTLAIVPEHSADFTGDGLVDAADLTQWRRDFGSNYLSDADDDGDSDGDDFLQWQRHLGGTQSVSSSTAAPEPSGAVLALSAIGIRLTRRRGGRTSFGLERRI
jgi:hypothetical protein